jgi:hypothetical protein
VCNQSVGPSDSNQCFLGDRLCRLLLCGHRMAAGLTEFDRVFVDHPQIVLVRCKPESPFWFWFKNGTDHTSIPLFADSVKQFSYGPPPRGPHSERPANAMSHCSLNPDQFSAARGKLPTVYSQGRGVRCGRHFQSRSRSASLSTSLWASHMKNSPRCIVHRSSHF